MRRITKILTIVAFASGLLAGVSELLLIVFQKPILKVFNNLQGNTSMCIPKVNVVETILSVILVVLFFDITMRQSSGKSKKICLVLVIFFFAGRIIFDIAESVEMTVLTRINGAEQLVVYSSLRRVIDLVKLPFTSLCSMSVCIVLGLQIADSQKKG